MHKLIISFLALTATCLIPTLTYSEQSKANELKECEVLDAVSVKLNEQANKAYKDKNNELLIKTNDSLQILSEYNQSCIGLKINAKKLNAFLSEKSIHKSATCLSIPAPSLSDCQPKPCSFTEIYSIVKDPSSNPHGDVRNDFSSTNLGGRLKIDIDSLRKDMLVKPLQNNFEKK